MGNSIKVYIAAHKLFDWLPDGYEPVQAGAKGKPHIFPLTDDSGVNISEKNPEYCEMTVLYWIWKNTKSDLVGMVHYRRFFFPNPWGCSPKSIPPVEFLSKKLGDADLLVPKPHGTRGRTIREVYAQRHHISDLDMCRKFIADNTSEYIPYFDSFMQEKSMSYYNMFVAKREVFEAYMEWIFPILDYCYEHIDVSQYDSYNRRVIGFLAERLFNVWLRANAKRYKIVYAPVQKVFDNKKDIFVQTCWGFFRTITGAR